MLAAFAIDLDTHVGGRLEIRAALPNIECGLAHLPNTGEEDPMPLQVVISRGSRNPD